MSKTSMHDFHYCYIKDKNSDKAKPVFTDTNCFVYKIEARFYVDKEIVDCSEYSEDSKFYDVANKKVIHTKEDQTKDVCEIKIKGVLARKIWCVVKKN